MQWGNAQINNRGASTGLHGSEDAGLWAERHVRRLLTNNGWLCRSERWKCRYGEIDLLMIKAHASGLRLLAVEVKARRCCGVDRWGLRAFNRKKRQRLARSLACWQKQHPWSCHGALEVVLALVPLPPTHKSVRWIHITELWGDVEF